MECFVLFFVCFFSFLLLAFICHGVVFSIYNSLKVPSLCAFGPIVHFSALFSYIVFALIGVPGYLRFGENVDGNILNNFGYDNKLINVVRCSYTISLITSMPLEIFVMRQIVLHYRGQPSINQDAAQLQITDTSLSRQQATVNNSETVVRGKIPIASNSSLDVVGTNNQPNNVLNNQSNNVLNNQPNNVLNNQSNNVLNNQPNNVLNNQPNSTFNNQSNSLSNNQQNDSSIELEECPLDSTEQNTGSAKFNFVVSLVVTILATLIAVKLNDVKGFLNVTGGVAGTCIGLVFPAACFLRATHKPWCSSTVIFSLILLIFGLWVFVYSLVDCGNKISGLFVKKIIHF